MNLLIGRQLSKRWHLRAYVAVCFLTLLFPVQAQDAGFKGYEHLTTEPLMYTVYRVADPIVIDGQASEDGWVKAPWSAYFSDIEGALKPSPQFTTRFKMLWNDESLFIYAELAEPHIWANLRKHDQIVFHDNDFEVFIDPDDDSQNYFEVEVNALNTIFDLFLPKPYRDGGPALISWDAAGLRSAIHVDGTVNLSDDTDKKWSVEMSIPFKNISLGNQPHIPTHGEFWRINFSRVEWDVNVKGKGYEKVLDPLNGKPRPEHNWVWSPQGIIDMHYPERWGYAFFSRSGPGDPSPAFKLPEDRIVKRYLWLWYYKQKDYKKQYAIYANDPGLLGITGEAVVLNERKFIVSCSCDDTRFLVSAYDQSNEDLWQINEQGIIALKKRTPTK